MGPKRHIWRHWARFGRHCPLQTFLCAEETPANSCFEQGRGVVVAMKESARMFDIVILHSHQLLYI